MNDRTRLTHEEAVELAAPFVLNALEPDEEEAVREHLRSCSLPHEEFAELGSLAFSKRARATSPGKSRCTGRGTPERRLRKA